MINSEHDFRLVWFGWVGFYGIPTLDDYLMPNPVYIYIYILNIYDFLTHFVDTFLNKLILLYAVKWFKLFLYNTNISIYY